MSRKSYWIAIAVVLMASCAYGQLSQTWSLGLANGVSEMDGLGIPVTGAMSANVSETQTMFTWSGGVIQSAGAGAGQTATAGGLGSSQGVTQILGGSGIQSGGTQTLGLSGNQMMGTSTGWLGGATGSQGAGASQSQTAFSWDGIATQTQQASFSQSGTVVAGLGGSGSIVQGVFVTASQSQL